MLILHKTSVRRQKWHIIHTGYSDDDLIRRVTMKATREFRGLNRNLRR